MNMKPGLLVIVALALSSALAEQATADTAYFLVSEIHQPCLVCDSYVLPISDPPAIEHARDLVANGPGIGGTIALANVVVGGDGFNRNVLAEGEPLWSWHITSLTTFADFTIELCDGSPTLVEADPVGFLANTSGVICFWGYTVTAEIPGPRLIPMGQVVAPLAAVVMTLSALALARRKKRTGAS